MAGENFPSALPRAPVDTDAEGVVDQSKDIGEPSGAVVGERQDNLFTKVIPLDSKAFYLDVRENRRGKYLKLTESGASGRNTLLLSGVAIKTVLVVLDDAIKEKYERSDIVKLNNSNINDNNNNNNNKNDSSENKWQTVYSQKVLSNNKKIYVDIMVNKRGRSLNIAEVSSSRSKTSVVMFERGWFQLKRALEEIVEKFPELNGNERVNEKQGLMNYTNSYQQTDFFQPKPILTKVVELQNKKLFFDFLSNEAGRYLRVSEVKPGKRDNVYIPALCFPVFVDLLEKLLVEDYTSSIAGLDNIPIVNNSNSSGTKPALNSESGGKFNDKSKELVKRSLKVEDERGNNSRRYSLDLRENSFGKFLRVAEHRLIKRTQQSGAEGQGQGHGQTQGQEEEEETETPNVLEREYTRNSAVYFPEETFAQIKSFFIEFTNVE